MLVLKKKSDESKIKHEKNTQHAKLLRVIAMGPLVVSQYILTLYLIKALFSSFANRADPDQAAHKSCLIRVYSVCLWNL